MTIISISELLEYKQLILLVAAAIYRPMPKQRSWSDTILQEDT